MLLYYGCFNREENEDESGRLFMALLTCNACALFLDQVTWALEGVPSLRVLYIVVYAALLYVPVVGVCSTLRLLRAKVSVKNKIVIALFYVVPMIFAVFYGSSSDATPPDAPLFAITLMYMVLVAERSRKLASTAAAISTISS